MKLEILYIALFTSFMKTLNESEKCYPIKSGKCYPIVFINKKIFKYTKQIKHIVSTRVNIIPLLPHTLPHPLTLNCYLSSHICSNVWVVFN